MNLYNATNDDIEDRFNGFTKIVRAGDTLNVNDDCGIHMLRRNKCLGLVELNYGPKEEEQFGSFKAFKFEKAKEGLSNYKKWMEQNLNQESMFPREVTLKNGGEVELATTQIPKIKEKIIEIDALIKEYSVSCVIQEVKPEIGNFDGFAQIADDLQPGLMSGDVTVDNLELRRGRGRPPKNAGQNLNV